MKEFVSRCKTSNRRGRIFVLSSPSGGGKTTLALRLLEGVPHLVRSISMTTRKKRAQEKEGRDYFFVSGKKFDAVKAKRGFLESAEVFGHRYGTPRDSVEERLNQGDDVLLVIDVQGARQVRSSCGKQAVLIFVMPPSLEELKSRLEQRSSDSEAEVRKRLRQAQKEMACARWYDYVVENRDLGQALEGLKAVMMAERLKSEST